MGDKILTIYIDLFDQKKFFGGSHPNNRANAYVTISTFSKI